MRPACAGRRPRSMRWAADRTRVCAHPRPALCSAPRPRRPRAQSARVRVLPGRAVKPRPSGRRGSSAAAPVPMTATLSARLFTRREMRRAQLADTASRTTPAGRCVHRMRCTPSDLPREATSEKTLCRSGNPDTMAANSSTTITRRGSVPAASSSIDRARASASVRSRKRSSARRLVSARPAESSSRSVMRPTQCGRVTSGANDEPPLKSTSRKLTVCGPERFRHRQHPGDEQLAFPLPVVPPMIAWGPSPTRSSAYPRLVHRHAAGQRRTTRSRTWRQRGQTHEFRQRTAGAVDAFCLGAAAQHGRKIARLLLRHRLRRHGPESRRFGMSHDRRRDRRVEDDPAVTRKVGGVARHSDHDPWRTIRCREVRELHSAGHGPDFARGTRMRQVGQPREADAEDTRVCAGESALAKPNYDPAGHRHRHGAGAAADADAESGIDDDGGILKHTAFSAKLPKGGADIVRGVVIGAGSVGARNEGAGNPNRYRSRRAPAPSPRRHRSGSLCDEASTRDGSVPPAAEPNARGRVPRRWRTARRPVRRRIVTSHAASSLYPSTARRGGCRARWPVRERRRPADRPSADRPHHDRPDHGGGAGHHREGIGGRRHRRRRQRQVRRTTHRARQACRRPILGSFGPNWGRPTEWAIGRRGQLTTKNCSPISTRDPRSTRWRWLGMARAGRASGSRTTVPFPEKRSLIQNAP